jgi:hypothetical protein
MMEGCREFINETSSRGREPVSGVTNVSGLLLVQALIAEYTSVLTNFLINSRGYG